MLILDLDNCIAAADEPGEPLLAPLFAVIREANDGALDDEALTRAFADCWRLPLEVVARVHRFTPAMLEAGWAVGVTLEVNTPMRGYGDLDELRRLPMSLALVTTGFRRLQESKVRALGLRSMMDEIHIDAIDEPDRRGKGGIFEHLLATHGLDPTDALVVGDNPDAEIAAGNALGIPTVQVLRPGVARGDNATHYIEDFVELDRLLAARDEGRGTRDERREPRAGTRSSE